MNELLSGISGIKILYTQLKIKGAKNFKNDFDNIKFNPNANEANIPDITSAISIYKITCSNAYL